jgi:LysR family transcriptional regulator, glycine cleavage system transcriptional activator
MPARLPPLNALRAFEAAARLQSVKLAAAELHVTPAAVSHQIKLIEALVGQPLLVRKARGIALTEVAKAVLPRLSAAFEQLAQAARELSEPGPESTLTVSVAPSFATCWLMPRLHRFFTASPGIDVRIAARTRQSDMSRGAAREAAAWLSDADVAIMLSQGELPGLHVDRLVPLSVTPLASPKLLRARRLRPADLRSFTLIHDDLGRRVDGRDFWDLWLAAAGADSRKLRHGVHFSHTMMALEAAAEGIGIVATVQELAAPQLESGKLIAPFAQQVALPYAYFLVAREQSLARTPVRSFVDWLRHVATSRRPE